MTEEKQKPSLRKLSTWTHPKTGETRLYFRHGVKDFKAWVALEDDGDHWRLEVDSPDKGHYVSMKDRLRAEDLMDAIRQRFRFYVKDQTGRNVDDYSFEQLAELAQPPKTAPSKR